MCRCCFTITNINIFSLVRNTCWVKSIGWKIDFEHESFFVARAIYVVTEQCAAYAADTGSATCDRLESAGIFPFFPTHSAHVFRPYGLGADGADGVYRSGNKSNFVFIERAISNGLSLTSVHRTLRQRSGNTRLNDIN